MQCQKLRTYMETGRVVFLPVRSIRPNPSQPRKVFQPEPLQELADSIARHGILQPLSVRRIPGGYELIAGERRLRAGELSGLTEIPCIVMNMDDRESGLTALVENLQRQDLDYIEEARGLSFLMEKWSMSQEQVSRLIGKSQSGVANKLRLLRHSPAVLQALREHELTERHARALLKLTDDTQKLETIALVARRRMGVAQTEQYIQQLLEKKAPGQDKANLGAFLNQLNRSLDKIRRSGVGAITEQRETDSQLVLTITIQKNPG